MSIQRYILFFESQIFLEKALQVRYLLFMISEVKVVNTKVVMKLVDTDFYELRISVGNEYRAILYTIDHENIVQAEQILLLSGFMKKSTEDMFQLEYGPKGTARREEFEAKARAWYYAEVLRDARKAAVMN